MNRRGVILGIAGSTVLGCGSRSSNFRSAARRPELTTLPKRIAFGSCAHQDKDQPVWDAINALRPDLFLFLGDNIYGDTSSARTLERQYEKLALQPGFRALCENTPVLAVWDDHDYGEDDAGADFPGKRESQRVFCDFWNEPVDSPRRSRDGIYDSLLIGSGERRLQLIIPDLRFNRTPPHRQTDHAEMSRPAPAPSMIGERQWKWLETEFAQLAQLRILMSSVPLAATTPSTEGWVAYPEDLLRLSSAIQRTAANGMICVSGDSHYGELSVLEVPASYPIYDMTSSGLTEVWHELPPNRTRMGSGLLDVNFGVLEIDWSLAAPTVRMQLRDVHGRIRNEYVVDSGLLRQR